MSDAIVSPAEYRRMADDLAAEKSRAERLTAENARRKDQYQKLRAEADAIAAERDKQAKRVAELDDQIRQAESAPPDAAAKRIAELERELKVRDVRATFEKQAKGVIREDAYEAAWKLAAIDVDAEGDLDDDKIGAAVGSLVETHAFLKPVPADSGGRDAGATGKPSSNGVHPAAGPGPGYQRGGGSSPSSHQPVDPAAAARDRLGAMGATVPGGSVIRL
jgi:hypothetical protein